MAVRRAWGALASEGEKTANWHNCILGGGCRFPVVFPRDPDCCAVCCCNGGVNDAGIGQQLSAIGWEVDDLGASAVRTVSCSSGAGRPGARCPPQSCHVLPSLPCVCCQVMWRYLQWKRVHRRRPATAKPKTVLQVRGRRFCVSRVGLVLNRCCCCRRCWSVAVPPNPRSVPTVFTGCGNLNKLAKREAEAGRFV